jgi:hypothetical protein
MATDLEQLTLERFLPHVGELFAAPATTLAGEPVALALRLDVTTALGDGNDDGRANDGRVPFALLFSGPADALLPQGVVALEHVTLGRLEIFLVPIGRDADGLHYEAVFN